MSFGTTGRAVLLNRMPLRQRFALPKEVLPWGPIDGDAPHPKRLAAWSRELDNDPETACPGWDSDGRPVEA